MHCTLYTSELYTRHCLTRIRFALVLRKIHFTLDDKLHFCGICIVMTTGSSSKILPRKSVKRRPFCVSYSRIYSPIEYDDYPC